MEETERYRLKDFYDEALVRAIGNDVERAHAAFGVERFVARCMDGLEPLELLARGSHIMEALHDGLPADYEGAIEILLKSLGPPLAATEGNGMAPFFYLPHTLYVSTYGLEHFELSMRANYELTQRFSAEASIRPFIERYTAKTLELLRLWARDPSVHVRRLVSEGTRPRLPWAPRLRAFQHDPSPVLALLELLKDDPDLYVRRSVANNLNDIGKDHPTVLIDVCRSWLVDASPERKWLVRHALRSAVKRGDPDALALLGYASGASFRVENVEIPATVAMGGRCVFACDLVNEVTEPANLLIDFRVHFVKANGSTSPRVFKLKAVSLSPGERARVGATISLRDMTTRRHYPGVHSIDLLINGMPHTLGAFDLLPRAMA